MRDITKFVARIACLAVAGCASTAHSAPVTYADFSVTNIADLYYGGLNTYSPGGSGDVIGPTNLFDTKTANISKTGDNLTVQFKTNYADTVGALNKGASDTYVGALFLGTGLPNYNNGTSPGVGSAPYASDTFKADPGRFDFAFVPTITNTPESATLATLYRLNGSGTDVQYSYYPNPGNIVDPSPGSGTEWRTNQAVGYLGSNATGLTGTWQVSKSADTITFSILNFFTLSELTSVSSTALTFAWAMTCANDYFMESVNLRALLPPPSVPVPAGIVLFLSALLGLGFFGRLKSKFLGSPA